MLFHRRYVPVRTSGARLRARVMTLGGCTVVSRVTVVVVGLQ